MFPPVSREKLVFSTCHLLTFIFVQAAAVPKRAAEDTTLVTKNHAGDTISIPIPKGSFISMNFCALHYNRKYDGLHVDAS